MAMPISIDQFKVRFGIIKFAIIDMIVYDSGEDIYGRIINSDNDGVIGSKYIPPAKRKLLTSTIDEVVL
jgi:hypothetical protein